MSSRQRKSNLKLLLLASYVNNLGWGIYAPLYGLYVLKLGGSSIDVSFLFGTYAVIAGTLMMIFGRLENNRRYNPAMMLVVGYGLFILVALGLLTAQTLHEFIAVQLTLAVAMGVLTPAARATYARAQLKGREAGEWGIFDGGNYILIAIASFSGGLLFKAGGFHAIFLSMLGVQIVSTYLAVMNLRSTRSRA